MNRLIIAIACLCLFLIGCQGPAASEDRGALGYVAPAIDVDINMDGVDRQSQPHVPLDESGEPEATVDAIEELLEGDDPGVLDAKRAANQARSSGGNVVYIREFHISVTGGNEAASRDSGGQNAEGARNTLSAPVQANTGGAAGTQGDTTTSTDESTTDEPESTD